MSALERRRGQTLQKKIKKITGVPLGGTPSDLSESVRRLRDLPVSCGIRAGTGRYSDDGPRILFFEERLCRLLLSR